MKKVFMELIKSQWAQTSLPVFLGTALMLWIVTNNGKKLASEIKLELKLDTAKAVNELKLDTANAVNELKVNNEKLSSDADFRIANAVNDMKLYNEKLASEIKLNNEKLASFMKLNNEKLASDTKARVIKLASSIATVENKMKLIKMELLGHIRVINERLSGNVKCSLGEVKGSLGEVKGNVQAQDSNSEASVGKLDMNQESHKRETSKANLEHLKTNGHSTTMKDESPMPKSDSRETDTGDNQEGEPVA